MSEPRRNVWRMLSAMRRHLARPEPRYPALLCGRSCSGAGAEVLDGSSTGHAEIFDE
jgi:hypothetical protein